MPKNTKKRKEKAADFSRSKLKLGKGKKLPSNAIDTSFKARSIVLPTQSITLEKDDNIPRTARKLSFHDLLVHLKHHNVSTRKDAILGLRELLENHRTLLEKSFSDLCQSVIKLLTDEDAGVRKSFISFVSYVLHRVPQEDLVPHASMFLLFTTSAMTHIFPEIRIDAVRFVNILLDRIPLLVVSGWKEDFQSHGNRLIRAYLSMLNAASLFSEGDAHQTVSYAVVTPSSKVVVLESLALFLKAAIPTERARSHGSSLSHSYLAPTFPRFEDFLAFDSLFRSETSSSAHSSLPPLPRTSPMPIEDWENEDLTSVQNSASNAGRDLNASASDGDLIQRLARSLHTTLVSTFLDNAATVFMPHTSPPEEAVKLTLLVVEIVRHLHSALFRMNAQPYVTPETSHNLKLILGHMVPYFPLIYSSETGVKKEAMDDFNLAFCELVSLVSISTVNTQDVQSMANRPMASMNNEWLKRLQSSVEQYLRDVLNGDTVANGLRSLTPTSYASLLPTMWSMLNRKITLKSSANENFGLIIDHAMKKPSQSSTKMITVEFVGRLALLSTEQHYDGHFKVTPSGADYRILEAWVVHLPQILWEAGARNLQLAEIILRILLRFLQRAPLSWTRNICGALIERLILYFRFDHPVKGPIPGPYSQLPSSNTSVLRCLALSISAILLSLTGSAGNHLAIAVKSAVIGSEEEHYWTEISSRT